MLYEDKIRLQRILEEAKEACQYVEGYSIDDFYKDGKTARAINSLHRSYWRGCI